jgi:hypothetical protein
MGAGEDGAEAPGTHRAAGLGITQQCLMLVQGLHWNPGEPPPPMRGHQAPEVTQSFFEWLN